MKLKFCNFKNLIQFKEGWKIIQYFEQKFSICFLVFHRRLYKSLKEKLQIDSTKLSFTKV